LGAAAAAGAAFAFSSSFSFFSVSTSLVARGGRGGGPGDREPVAFRVAPGLVGPGRQGVAAGRVTPRLDAAAGIQDGLAGTALRFVTANDTRNCRISGLVLVELSWVLASAYKFPKQDVAGAIAATLSLPGVAVEDEATVRAALGSWRAARGDVDCADCMIRHTAAALTVDALVDRDHEHHSPLPSRRSACDAGLRRAHRPGGHHRLEGGPGDARGGERVRGVRGATTSSAGARRSTGWRRWSNATTDEAGGCVAGHDPPVAGGGRPR
jgi:predicted nucleic-acid-binding protein